MNFNMHSFSSTSIVTFLAIIGLTACGGSSDKPTPVKTSHVKPIITTSISCSEATQKQMLDSINKARSNGRYCYGSTNGKTFYPASDELKWNGYLAKSASSFAVDMAENNYYAGSSHLDRSGRDLEDRIKASGYGVGKTRYIMGENIASGQPSIETVMDDWLDSKNGHCESIMRADIKDFGMGCGYNPNSQYKNYWVQNFGAALK